MFADWPVVMLTNVFVVVVALYFLWKGRGTSDDVASVTKELREIKDILKGLGNGPTTGSE